MKYSKKPQTEANNNNQRQENKLETQMITYKIIQ